MTEQFDEKVLRPSLVHIRSADIRSAEIFIGEYYTSGMIEVAVNVSDSIKISRLRQFRCLGHLGHSTKDVLCRLFEQEIEIGGDDANFLAFLIKL